jgi:hypothetical protein
MIRDTPALLKYGVLRLLTGHSFLTITTWLGGVLALMAALFTVWQLPSVLRPWAHLLILLAAIIAGIFGVILIHTAAWADPTIHGYSNRGLSSFSLLLPMLVAVASALAHRIGRWCTGASIAMAICFFAAYLASFLVQRDNYIAAVRLQSEILADLMGKLDLPLKSDHTNIDVTPSTFVIGSVPQFLITNFNDETIFSHYSPDWNNALIRHRHGRLGGITAAELCNRQSIQDGHILFYGTSVPIAGAWYYAYSQREPSSILLRIRDESHLRHLLQSDLACSAP